MATDGIELIEVLVTTEPQEPCCYNVAMCNDAEELDKVPPCRSSDAQEEPCRPSDDEEEEPCKPSDDEEKPCKPNDEEEPCRPSDEEEPCKPSNAQEEPCRPNDEEDSVKVPIGDAVVVQEKSSNGLQATRTDDQMARNKGFNPDWRRWGIILLKAVSICAVVFLVICSILLLVAVIRSLLLKAKPSTILHALEGRDIDMIDESEAMVRALRLAGALKIRTISHGVGDLELKEHLKMHDYLEKSFPLIHNASYITREVVNGYSLLYTVQGTVNGTLPYLLASHMDVVPVNEASWEVPPFAGIIVNDTYIYGRGALDVKCGVMGIMEGLEYMLKSGKRPMRTFYIAFGHDEEVGGMTGAKYIAEALKARGVESLDFLIDEGLPLTEGVMPGTDKTVALIGVTEKGSLSLELQVLGTPGHSSMPPRESAIGILAEAVARLESKPLPSMFGRGPEAQTFSDVAPHCSFGYKLLYDNLWLFSPLMTWIMAKNPVTNANVRTTTAITLFNGGVKENVVPASATATVNFRIHPSQSVAEVWQAVKVIIDDPRVTMTAVEGSVREPHPVSPSGPEDVPYLLLATSLQQVFGDVVVVPGVLIANTDTRWYLSFTRHVYRHFPFVLRSEDIARVHGDNERLTVAAYHAAVNFFYRVMRNADLLIDVVPVTSEHYGAEL